MGDSSSYQPSQVLPSSQTCPDMFTSSIAIRLVCLICHLTTVARMAADLVGKGCGINTENSRPARPSHCLPGKEQLSIGQRCTLSRILLLAVLGLARVSSLVFGNELDLT